MTPANHSLEFSLATRIAGSSRYYLAKVGEGEPVNLPDQIRKSIAYVQHEVFGKGVWLDGTAFFVNAADTNDGKATKHEVVKFTYAVTAKHVIDGIREANRSVQLRLNAPNGEPIVIESQPNQWLTHPTDQNADVAVLPWPDEIGTEAIDAAAIPITEAITMDDMRSRGLGIGDTVFSIGLLKAHPGKRRNIPIARTGTIAALPEEPVLTPWGEMDAYLVELRSIRGMSGSPVLIPKVQHPHSSLGLLGVMHGHWSADKSESDMLNSARLHLGIGIVSPIEYVLDIIDQPQLIKERSEIAKQKRAQRASTAD